MRQTALLWSVPLPDTRCGGRPQGERGLSLFLREAFCSGIFCPERVCDISEKIFQNIHEQKMTLKRTMQHFVIILKEMERSLPHLSEGCMDMKNCDTSRKETVGVKNYLLKQHKRSASILWNCSLEPDRKQGYNTYRIYGSMQKMLR